jgi:CheY-like chemotaxis protein
MTVQHILVVDDSKSARLILRKMLQGLGMIVDTAESAEDALDYLRARRPDAIFMDHTMPGMNGLEALRRIKSDPATVQIPVAMYTCKDEPSYQQQASAVGAVGVLNKPATVEAISVIFERMNALLDATRPPADVPAPAGETATPAWVEKLAVEKAEQVFYDAIESQVLPFINDVVAKLRQDLASSQEAACHRIVEARPVEATVRALLSPVEERLEAFQREGWVRIEGRVREVAAEVCQNQLHELSNRLAWQMSTRFTEAVQGVGATAREIAIDAARDAARETALQAVGQAEALRTSERNAIEAAEAVARRLCADIQHDLKRRVYLTAAGAAVAGIGAALLAYGMR